VGGSSKRLMTPRLRKCVACGLERPKTELLRVVRSPGGDVSVNDKGASPGRGAYICSRIECLRLAAKKNALSRALKHPVPKEIYTRIEELCVDRGCGENG
jgi:predicted RNA-binding protein YlxR (DUF448 family)